MHTDRCMAGILLFLMLPLGLKAGLIDNLCRDYLGCKQVSGHVCTHCKKKSTGSTDPKGLVMPYEYVLYDGSTIVTPAKLQDFTPGPSISSETLANCAVDSSDSVAIAHQLFVTLSMKHFHKPEAPVTILSDAFEPKRITGVTISGNPIFGKYYTNVVLMKSVQIDKSGGGGLHKLFFYFQM